MSKKTKANRSGRGRRREWMMNVGLIAYIISFVLRIPLGRMIGDKGIGFYAGVMEMYLVINVIFSYGVSKALAALVRYRARREMFRSAKRVYRDVMMFTLAIGALLMVSAIVFCGFFSETLLLEPRGYLAVAAIAPAIFLSAVTGVMRGYFQGMGTMVPTIQSKLVEKVVQFVASLMLAAVFYSYGEKVAALLKTSEFAAAYGAVGAALGMSVACFFSLLHLIFIHVVYAKTFKRQLARDNTKYAESNAQIFLMFFQAALPYILCAMLYNMNYIVDQRIFNYAMNVKEKGSLRTGHWGVYYGKYSVVVGLAATKFGFVGAKGVSREFQSARKGLSLLGASVVRVRVRAENAGSTTPETAVRSPCRTLLIRCWTKPSTTLPSGSSRYSTSERSRERVFTREIRSASGWTEAFSRRSSPALRMTCAVS